MWRTGLVWGLFMGVSSNTRYQIVFGLERMVDMSIAKKVMISSPWLIRAWAASSMPRPKWDKPCLKLAMLLEKAGRHVIEDWATTLPAECLQVPQVAYVSTVIIRFINNVIGGENFIDMARWAKIQ